MQVYVSHVSGYPGRVIAAALQGEDGVEDARVTGSVLPGEAVPKGVHETALVSSANSLVAVRQPINTSFSDWH